ncbi:Spx/MgsR family RNA polymerase-binding regulatory protein [Acetobacterium malicum]|uniref:Spx/MgsR family RNA polymerase-binding regulatory protein n=1 Tax=Acetobacterium malicum TaxID=52692 RepID=A0ABR6YZ29_9FIRM|nr:arsenate reductase family protein [Acetobacterium malicum]MBC3900461.1 Spx/MgsR family RNA polymerase-binding regulatory protein [Acetobacterium malicum]
MKPLFLCYPKCSTCQKAKKFLAENQIDVEERHIVEDHPHKDELIKWMNRYQGEAKKFFNTSGLVYRDMELKDKVKTMTLDQMAEVLATNGMLVKRPLVILADTVLVGFKEEQWKAALLTDKQD